MAGKKKWGIELEVLSIRVPKSKKKELLAKWKSEVLEIIGSNQLKSESK